MIQIREAGGGGGIDGGGVGRADAIGKGGVVGVEKAAEVGEVILHLAHVGEIVEVRKHLDGWAFAGAGVGAADVADDVDVFTQLNGDIAVDGVFEVF